MKAFNQSRYAIAFGVLLVASSCAKVSENGFSQNSFTAIPQLDGIDGEDPTDPENPDTPDGTPTGTPTGTPSGTPTGTPSGTPTGTPTGTPSGTPPVVTPSGTPSPAPTALPSPAAPTKPNGKPLPPGKPSDKPPGKPPYTGDNPSCVSGLILDVRAVGIHIQGEKPFEIPVGKKVDLAKIQNDLVAGLGITLPKTGKLTRFSIILVDRHIALADSCLAACPGGVFAPSSDTSGIKIHADGVDLANPLLKIALPLGLALHSTGHGKCIVHPSYKLQ